MQLEQSALPEPFNHGRTLYDPEIKPNFNLSKEEYRQRQSTAFNHFYEKLLLLKDKMNTQTARQIAESRHAFMKQFMEEFLKEC